MVLKWTRTKPEPLKYFEQELNLNQNRYLKRFETLLLDDNIIVAIIGVARIFDWGGKPQITCNDVIRNFERETFCGGKNIVEWKIRSRGLVLARN